MAKKRNMSSPQLDTLSRAILGELKAHFLAAGLTAQDLFEGYIGVPIKQLSEKLNETDRVSQVDFDLSLKALEDGKFVETGPMVPYENNPGSGVFVVAIYSKREYAYLTEAGYRVQTQPEKIAPHRGSATQIHISGGNFHQSPIAVGEQVTLQQRNENLNDAEIVADLARLLSDSGVQVDNASREDLKRLVATAQQGNLTETRPIFQKIFGLATETVKQAAWGILTAVITKQMGL